MYYDITCKENTYLSSSFPDNYIHNTALDIGQNTQLLIACTFAWILKWRKQIAYSLPLHVLNNSKRWAQSDRMNANNPLAVHDSNSIY